MKRSNVIPNVIPKVFSFVFAAIVLFTVSVHETHYLFAEHHTVREHCENHLHSEDTHGDCAVCKFDVSFFTDIILFPLLSQQNLFVENISASYQSVISDTEVFCNSLRGPPALA